MMAEVPNASSPSSQLCPGEHRYEDAWSCRGVSKHQVENLTPPAQPGRCFPVAAPVIEQPERQDDPSKVNTELLP